MEIISITALVPSSHGSDNKRYVVTPRRVAYRLKEQKRSQFKQSTQLIKDFKYGPSLSIFNEKKNEVKRSNNGQFFITIITRHVSSILVRVKVRVRGIEGQNTV